MAQKGLLLVPKGEALQRVQARLDEGTEILQRPIQDQNDLDQADGDESIWFRVTARILDTLVDDMPEVSQFRTGSYRAAAPWDGFRGAVDALHENLRDRLVRLRTVKQCIDLLPEYEPRASEPRTCGVQVSGSSSRVFVVHGHDEGAKQSVARVLERLELEPVILHEQPDQGRTVIEKFEDYSDVGFAVVLLTPDDMGYAVAANPKTAKPRARQTVIMELGYFLGKLGRGRVCALYRHGVELPSDFSGVLILCLTITVHGTLN
jgi:predicted nucleotide-binding protein